MSARALKDHELRRRARLGQHDGPLMLDGPMYGAAFLANVQQRLAPITLKRGDTVIMNNLPARKVAGLRAAIETPGARLRLLLPDLPDFNPIENAFAKLKALLRKPAARTVPDLRATSGPLSPTPSRRSRQPGTPTISYARCAALTH